MTHPINDYIRTSREVVKLWKERKGPTITVEEEFMESLHKLRKWLDDKGLTMPAPKYRFDIHNKKTWKYIEVLGKDKKYQGFRENPDFIFRN